MVLEGLRGENSIVEICLRDGISPNVYYRWSKAFPETGKKRVAGDLRADRLAPFEGEG